MNTNPEDWTGGQRLLNKHASSSDCSKNMRNGRPIVIIAAASNADRPDCPAANPDRAQSASCPGAPTPCSYLHTWLKPSLNWRVAMEARPSDGELQASEKVVPLKRPMHGSIHGGVERAARHRSVRRALRAIREHPRSPARRRRCLLCRPCREVFPGVQADGQ